MIPEMYHMALAIILIPVLVFVGFDLYQDYKKYRRNQDQANKRDIDDAVKAQQSGFPVPVELLDRIENEGR